MDKNNPSGDVYLFENNNSNFAILIYGVDEVRMNAELGFFAIIKDLKNPQVLLNSSETMVLFRYDKTVLFFDSIEIVAIYLNFYDRDSEFWYGEYMFFDLKNEKVAFAKVPIGGSDLKQTSKYTVLMNRSVIRDEEKQYTVDLRELEWAPIEELDQVKEKFFKLHVPAFLKRKRAQKIKNNFNKFGITNIFKKITKLFFSDTLFIVYEMRLINSIWGLNTYHKNKDKFLFVSNVFRLIRFLFRCSIIIGLVFVVYYLIPIFWK